MGTSKLKVYTTATLAALCLLFTAVFSARPMPSEAAENAAISLKPIAASSTPYFYFGGTTAVYASENGVTVSTLDDAYTVSFDNVVSHKFHKQNAVKTHDLGKFTVSLLTDGRLLSYYGDSYEFYSDQNIVDFDTTADKIYAITADKLVTLSLTETSFDTSSANVVDLFSDKYRNIRATAITVCDGVPFVAVDSNFGVKQDICSVSTATGALNPVLAQSDAVISLASNNKTVYSLTRDSVCAYSVSGGGLIKTNGTDGGTLTDIYGYNGAVYAITSLDAVVKFPSDLSSFTTLVASADGAEGFFNTPINASVKNSTLFVADSVNGRVATFGEKAEYLSNAFINPVAAVSDSAGAIYVAHKYNEIVKISDGETKSVTVDGIISDIAVDADKKVYILTADGKIYSSVGFASPTLLVEKSGFKAIALSVGSERLYALSSDAVYRIVFDDNKYVATKYCDADDEFISLAVDIGGAVYLLSQNSIVRVDGSKTVTRFSLKVGDAAYSLGFTAGKILISTVKNSFVEYGDAIIVDTYKHRLFTASGAADKLNIKLIDGNYEIPNVAHNGTPRLYNGLIRTALYDTQVFEYPMETPSVYTIAKGRKVIVPAYTLTDTREYSLILIDNLATGELIQGYVYRDSLSEPLPYTPAPTNVGTVYSSATPVYKWPSPNAPTVTGFSAVERGTDFTILDFVESYHDDYNNLWYRIQIGEKYEGYMLASNLSMMNYEPIFIRPAYNAEIISYENSEYAIGYKLVDGEYKEIDATFPTGTKVEVVGTFDTSLEYTQIKYLDSELGTLTCYVKTVYIKYNGVNIVLIVAIIVIIITVALAAIIIGRVLYLKRKRPVSTSDK